jgi:ABC-2 type transport system permease protein
VLEPRTPGSVASLRRNLRVVGALVRASLMTGMQYRSDFLFDSLTGLLRPLATAAPLWVVYQHTDTIMGWSLADAALVMALFLMLEGLVGGIIEPNLGMVVEAVRTGTLDLVLMKPADAQLLVSLRSIAPARMWDLIAAALVGAWAMSHRELPTLIDTLVAVCMLGCGLASMYSLWLLAICASFWFVRVDNLRFLLDATLDAGRWPITVFTGWLRWSLTVVIPVGIITSFPVLALRGQWDAALIAVALCTAAVFVLGSRAVWVRSLKSYTSASS